MAPDSSTCSDTRAVIPSSRPFNTTHVPYQSAPADTDLVTTTVNPFVDVDLSGFEPTHVTTEKRRDAHVIDAGLPLRHYECLRDLRADPHRFNNILGGFVGHDKIQKENKEKKGEDSKNKNQGQ
ncbi:hypothetical protein P3342_011184 [Pyrenophora teres f. teres]|nr:hypothetical protein P3342_011184 [Pyrenophora teres f. teres]